MSRAPWVIAGTLAGIAGLFTFHTTPIKVMLATVPTTQPPSGGRRRRCRRPARAPRSAAAVNYYYGTLAVSVAASGSTITSVTIASLNDGGYSYSQSIDQASIPILEQEAKAAQSANIQGVSGASYTSAGFAQSLQSALTKLGL